MRLSLADIEVNALAQLFYETSGINLPNMTDKPKVVAGLTAVLDELGITVRNTGEDNA